MSLAQKHLGLHSGRFQVFVAVLALTLPIAAKASSPALWGNPSCPAYNANLAVSQEQKLDNLISSGGNFEIAGRPSDAQSAWREAFVYARSVCFPVPLNAGDQLLQHGKASRAFAEYLKAFSAGLNPAYSDYDAFDPWMKGMQAGAHGDMTTAEQLFRQAIKAAPVDRTNGFPEAHFMLGAALYAQGSNEEATREWRATLARSGPPQPDWVEAGTVWPSALRFYGLSQGWDRN
jgi:TolA-binding protein